MFDMKHRVYTLTFANGVTYVGSTRDLKRRFENHLNRFRSGKNQTSLQTLYDKHGTPTMQEVANAFSLDQLHELEQKNNPAN